MEKEDEDIRDAEFPDESDMDPDGDPDGPELIPCPYCEREIIEDTDICPYCGSFISKEDAPLHVPGWIWIGVILCLIVVVYLWFN